MSLVSLAALYTLYEQGNGFRRSRLYGRYETERLEREHKGNGFRRSRLYGRYETERLEREHKGHKNNGNS